MHTLHASGSKQSGQRNDRMHMRFDAGTGWHAPNKGDLIQPRSPYSAVPHFSAGEVGWLMPALYGDHYCTYYLRTNTLIICVCFFVAKGDHGKEGVSS